MSKLNKIKEQNPEIEVTEQVASIADQIDQLHDIKSLADTAGGKQLLHLLLQDVINDFNLIRNQYTTLTHEQLIPIVARMDARYELARVVKDAKAGLEILEADLEQALRDY